MPVNCPNCNATSVRNFYRTQSVPVHSCMMCADAAAALAFPKRDLELGFCESCGFIYNTIFDADVQRYAEGYEAQQSFSPRFRTFQTELIAGLIERYDLRGKDVVEIGCGKGDFLIELCRASGGHGVGIDPSCDPHRTADCGDGSVRFVAEHYAESHGEISCDLLCCRHTLEHIHRTNDFVAHMRKVVGGKRDTIVFFEVPDVSRVLREQAFWDIYYEHCSYFSLGSLARVFRANGFDIVELARDFDDQYLLIVASPADGPTVAALSQEDDLAEVAAEVDAFEENVQSRIDGLRKTMACLKDEGKRVAIWGSGSKCVSFLSTAGAGMEVAAVVDINPNRQGKYLAGSGQQVVGPEALIELGVEAVLVMNPIYVEEIGRQLDEMGLVASLIPC